MRFGVDQSSVSRIFSCWLEGLDACMQEIPMWRSKEETQALMLAAFHSKYGNTRVIIDAAEIEIDQPKNTDTHSETW